MMAYKALCSCTCCALSSLFIPTRSITNPFFISSFLIDNDTFIFDTPGFTSVESPTFDKEELRFHFNEFAKYEGKCRFAGCIHINEPDCAVKEALEKEYISEFRYQSYKKMYEEMSESRRY